ncbi:glycosyltransferase family 2 protein [Dolichospermum circinale CS-1225]|uniref:Glycosyltransferase family 2 protein n=1 Tax=Dolichospermum circinale CS-537/01 TaxID=3021739 RepID=A0ABT4ZZZ6_9CYAN|nr:glycosyltransferase family 2 protein [Dolichospermum circinale]MDB9465747.1 glycosyltransferase family 2 protein [Dolichospermum circinale CS-539/09]MDB9470614.1 glycosyltransferase family 2 protein [Dolichospermum circinale CS-539]MDB9485245.1 glycosyltransferase family 2 protein [Dolichospermum circinale CS-537/01]MDB9520902.1 glycosyltransferase family 2 protein [Dolichospermum circinale CS-1225]
MPDLMIFLSKSLLGWLLIQSCLTLIFLWYLRSYKPRLLPDEKLPKTAVILCLRGADPFLHNCLRSLLQQNYPQYDLKLIIDSQEDPALKIASETINQLGATNVQINILRAVRYNCSLKCSSLIQAVSDLDNAYPVIAFIDADTVVHPNWLRELVTPLLDDKVGLTTGNRWYLPTGNYWGSLVRYSGNVSTVVQMFLFQIPWGGTLAIKTEVLNRIKLLDKWGQVLTDDMLLHKLIKKQKLQIKFIPSLLMLNQEESSLSNLLESLKRLIISSKLYHPGWLAIISEAYSSILVPNLVIIIIFYLLLQSQWYAGFLLFSSYISYTIGLVLLMVLMEVAIHHILHNQGKKIPKLSPLIILKMLIAIPFTQWIYGLIILSSLWTSSITWRGITYRIQGRENIRLIEYRPYQWLDQPIDSKASL